MEDGTRADTECKAMGLLMHGKTVISPELYVGP